ncbi:MAG: 7-cyano-7-deazaguanine synthase, partial [Candidatus Lokiarchaeota archaeon]
PQGFIPLRNLVFYSIAAYYASIYGYQFIIGGHLKEDLDIFNDTSSSFFNRLGELITISRHSNDNSKIEFIFPFSEKTKAEVIKIAQELNVPIDKTWSCYGDFEKPCGRCIPCINRKKAMDFLKQQNSLN